MKLLFLDVDGVLNNENTEPAFLGLEDRLVKKYLDWLEGKDITVVLSSSWRTSVTAKDILNDNGIHWSYETPTTYYVSLRNARSRRVEEVISQLKPEYYAVLDDNDFGFARDHFVQTSFKYGLRDKNLRRLDKVLNT